MGANGLASLLIEQGKLDDTGEVQVGLPRSPFAANLFDSKSLRLEAAGQ
jgi:hypothetical protein